MKEFLESSYYTQAVSFAFAIIGLSTFFIRRIRNNLSKKISVYFGGYIILCTTNFICAFLRTPEKANFLFNLQVIADFLFTVLEFRIFSNLISNIIISKKRTRVLILANRLFAIAAFVYCCDFSLYETYKNLEHLQSLLTFQAILLLVSCAFYFEKIYKGVPNFELINQPDFWILTGLSFTLICSLPNSLFSSYLVYHSFASYKNLFAIFYLLYILFFAMIIKGILCAKANQQ